MLLNEPVETILDKNFLVLPQDVTIAEAQSRTRNESIIIVNQDARPLGILSSEVLSQLPSLESSLEAYKDRFTLPTLTNPTISLKEVLQGMVYDRSIRSYIAVEAGDIIGVALRATLLAVLQQFVGPPTVLDISVVSPVFNQLFGNPVLAPSKLCYRCQIDPTHCFPSESVATRDVQGRALCPCDGSVMISENPCLSGI